MSGIVRDDELALDAAELVAQHDARLASPDPREQLSITPMEKRLGHALRHVLRLLPEGPATGTQQKAYLAMSGEDDDEYVHHVFSRKEDAQDYELSEYVRERDFQDGPVEVRTWHKLVWWPLLPDQEASTTATENPAVFPMRLDYDGQEGRVEIELTLDSHWPRLRVSGWDLDLVKMAYREQRAAYEQEVRS